MSKEYVSPRWIKEEWNGGVAFYAGGYVEPMATKSDVKFEMIISYEKLHMLIKFLEDNGYVKPKFNRDEDDVKVINRLIDLLHEKGKKRGKD